MADVFQHQPRGRLDVDLFGGDADCFHQLPGIRSCPIGGAETRHGIAADDGARQAERVAGARRHQQRMRAVEPARNADDQRLGISRFDPADEGRNLNVERLVTILVQLALPVGHEGEAANRTVEADVPARRFVIEADGAIPVLGPAGGFGGIVEGLHPHPFVEDALAIDIGHAQFRLTVEANAFHHQFAKLVDHPLPVPGEVRGALAMAAGRIGIGTNRARGTGAAEQMALVRFADDDVGGGKIEDERRTRQRRHGSGLGRRPEIFADLHAEDETGDGRMREEEIGSEWNLLSARADGEADAVAAMREPALLVIFPVIWQEALGHHAEHCAAADRQSTIVDAAIAPQRRADHEHCRNVAARLRYSRDFGIDRVEQRVLQMKIVERVRGKAQFGIEQHIDMTSRRALRLVEYPARIIRDVRRSHLRRAGRHTHETVSVQVEKGVAGAVGHICRHLRAVEAGQRVGAIRRRFGRESPARVCRCR